MNQVLINHIQKFVAIDNIDIELINSCFRNQPIKKKENVLEEGQVCSRQYFIVKGCCRLYIVNKKGVEQTLQFGIENWWITDYMSFDSRKPSTFYIQAVENSEVLSINKTTFDDLLLRLPKLEHYFRMVTQRAFAASQMRIMYLYTMTAEERYHHINSSFPEFVQRVPQYMLASYLDFSAEFMSKIRARKV